MQLKEGSKARAAATRLKNKEAEELASVKLQIETKGESKLSEDSISCLHAQTAPRGAKVAALKNAGECFLFTHMANNSP